MCGRSSLRGRRAAGSSQVSRKIIPGSVRSSFVRHWRTIVSTGRNRRVPRTRAEVDAGAHPRGISVPRDSGWPRVARVRYLLDEDMNPAVAEVGRGTGLDVVSVHEIERRGLSDPEQLASLPLSLSRPLTPAAVYERLRTILPDFAAYWTSPDNLFREDDGSFSLCGVFVECSGFVRERFQDLTPAQLSELGEFISKAMGSPGTDLDDAAATCFLENLVSEPFSEILAGYLSGDAQRYYLDSHAA